VSDDNELGSNLFEEQPAPKAKKAAKKDANDRTWIVLEESTDIPPTGLPISVNGETVMVMAGEPVHLPTNISRCSITRLSRCRSSTPRSGSSARVTGIGSRIARLMRPTRMRSMP
jgi:hypothetical protein